MAMSFAAGAKAEICRMIPQRKCCALAQCFGILLFGNSFSADVRFTTPSLKSSTFITPCVHIENNFDFTKEEQVPFDNPLDDPYENILFAKPVPIKPEESETEEVTE